MLEWYVQRGGKRAGPFDDRQMRGYAAAGKLRPTDRVWKTGDAGWTEAQAVPGLLPAPGEAAVAAAGGAPAAAPRTLGAAASGAPLTMGATARSGSDAAAMAARADPENDAATGRRADGARPLARADLALAAFDAGDWAGFWRRCGAGVLDNLFLSIASSFVFGLLFGMIALTGKPGAALALLAYPLMLALVIGYQAFFIGGPEVATLGRMATGVAVLDEASGAPVGTGRAAWRALLSWIGWITLVPNLVMLFTARKRSLPDLIARTVVVRYKTGGGVIGVVAGLLFPGIALVGIVAAVAIPQYQSTVVRARAASARQDLDAYARLVEQELRRSGAVPRSLETLQYTPLTRTARFSIREDGMIVAEGIGSARGGDFLALRPAYDKATDVLTWSCVSNGLAAWRRAAPDCPQVKP